LGYDGLRRVTQIAIVVRDVERARAFWSELLGIEKNPVTETESWESTHMMFRGKPSEGRAKLTFFNLENIVLELIQPVDGPSTWQDFLEKHGEGIHHIAFHVENLDEILEKFRRMGIEMEQKGEFKGGCYVYNNSADKLGAIIELLHMHS
jgi:methylmalonyl-CoA epimerase